MSTFGGDASNSNMHGVDGDIFNLAVPAFRKTRSGAEFSPWQIPVAVFAPAASADFDFDTLLQHAIDAEDGNGDDLEDYEIEPVVSVLDCPPFASSTGPPAPTLPIPPHTTPSTSTSSTPAPTSARSRHAPPKPGTNESAYRKARGKAREKLKAKQRRDAAPYGDFVVKTRLIDKHIKKPEKSIRTGLNAMNMPHASTGYLGKRDSGGAKRVFRLEELVGNGSQYGFELRKWDGCVPTPILDHKERVIGVCAGRPDDASWETVQQDAAAAVDDARGRCQFSRGSATHRRGQFPALAIGASFGGGQQVPGNLVNSAINAAILYALLSNIAFIRIAGFASAAFATWSPHLYAYYVDHLGPLFKTYPRLKRNFLNSVFACATFNFGPNTCCFDHVDSANLPSGWCAITALGRFDPTLGGHLVLWDLKLVIEFPPGSTILIPSGAIRHFNIAIGPDESRYSFTQYTAGGLFRWVDHGYQTETSYKKGWNKARKQEEEEVNKQRWLKGVSMFSTLEELKTMSRD